MPYGDQKLHKCYAVAYAIKDWKTPHGQINAQRAKRRRLANLRESWKDPLKWDEKEKLADANGNPIAFDPRELPIR